jgi:hypothetical protein
MTPEGHFVDTQAGVTLNRYCDLYEDLWIAWGAARLGRFEVSLAVFRFCSRFFAEEYGGFRSTTKAAPPIDTSLYDLRSTALAGLVALALGAPEVAAAAGRFAMVIMDLQPNPLDEFFLARDETGDLFRSYPPELARAFVIPRFPDRSQTPLYYALGLGIVLLASLYETTGNVSYLAGAERYATICQNYGEEILRNHYSGKLGWAFSLLWRLTNSDKYARISAIALDYLMETQLPDGSWSVPTLFTRYEDQPLAFTIDRTAEYTLWIKFIESNNAVRGTGRVTDK